VIITLKTGSFCFFSLFPLSPLEKHYLEGLCNSNLFFPFSTENVYETFACITGQQMLVCLLLTADQLLLYHGLSEFSILIGWKVCNETILCTGSSKSVVSLFYINALFSLKHIDAYIIHVVYIVVGTTKQANVTHKNIQEDRNLSMFPHGFY